MAHPHGGRVRVRGPTLIYPRQKGETVYKCIPARPQKREIGGYRGPPMPLKKDCFEKRMLISEKALPPWTKRFNQCQLSIGAYAR